MTADSRRTCARCGVRYEVFIRTKPSGVQDEHVICDCGWPLKDWIGVKAYIFRRVSPPRQETEKNSQRQ
jgi:hypothetical protein